MAQPQEFPFNIMDVAELLHLHIRRRQADSVYADCPICGDKRGKMNINFAKNLWRCNYCNEGGGMLSLYGKVYGISNSEAYREICDTLQNGLTAPEYTVKELPEKVVVEQSALASPQEIHQTFSMLLELLTLSPQHRKHLQEVRGLTDEQIERLGYKSTPPFYLCRSLTEKLRSRGCKVEGVPGFYVGKDDKWTVNFNSITAGIIIPARGIDGMIRGAQIRLDTPIRDQESDPDKSGTKYLWLSSSSKKRGVSSGSPVHFVGDPFARVVYVTEGLLKADVAHYLMDRSFAATAGANNVNKLDMLFALLAANGTEVIIEAEDMDKYHNAAVSKGASKIYLMARSHGLECRRLTWDPNYKGIDDWQLAMRQKKERRNVTQMNFRTRFVCGLCAFDAISEEIAAWHDRDTDSSTLHDYLGLSEQEYARFLRDGDAALEQYLLSLRAQQCFRIYQPDVSEGKAADFAFGGIKALQKAGYEQPPASEYALVYDGILMCEAQQSDTIRLKLVAARYSGDLPADYHGRSVSPSTVIEFYDENGRRYRQMFFYKDGTLYQSRLYPADTGNALEVSKLFRHLVQKAISRCLTEPNLWYLKTKRSDLDAHYSTCRGSLHYPDYNFHGNLSILQGHKKDTVLPIGAAALCVCCGNELLRNGAIDCSCKDVVVCRKCGQTVARGQGIYLEDGFYCKTCLHICEACGRPTLDTMYPAYDRRGSLLQICHDCYQQLTASCTSCSMAAACRTMGFTICKKATIPVAA